MRASLILVGVVLLLGGFFFIYSAVVLIQYGNANPTYSGINLITAETDDAVVGIVIEAIGLFLIWLGVR
jgi:hypothetical protein